MNISKEINPLSLNITNSLDLIEKLKPLLYITVSYLEKFKNVNNHNPHDTLEIKARFFSRRRDFSGDKNLFEIKFKFDHLTHEHTFRKINLRIKNIIKKNHFNFIFNTKPIKTTVTFRIFRPDAEARIVRRAYYDEERRFGINWRAREIPLRIINTKLTFKSDESVIFLANLPKVLFCICGHLCICEECDRVESLNTCPVCKIETTIKRVIGN